MVKRIAIGADHGGFALKEKLKKWLASGGYKITDYGTRSASSCDYPLIGYRVARDVSTGKFARAILVCKTGIGMAVVANKLPGVRAAVCGTVSQAKTSREHNDTNALSLAAKYINFDKAKRITRTWLNTKALGGRHARRVRQISKIDGKR